MKVEQITEMATRVAEQIEINEGVDYEYKKLRKVYGKNWALMTSIDWHYPAAMLFEDDEEEEE